MSIELWSSSVETRTIIIFPIIIVRLKSIFSRLGWHRPNQFWASSGESDGRGGGAVSSSSSASQILNPVAGGPGCGGSILGPATAAAASNHRTMLRWRWINGQVHQLHDQAGSRSRKSLLPRLLQRRSLEIIILKLGQVSLWFGIKIDIGAVPGGEEESFVVLRGGAGAGRP